jgi:hypothetical protein
MDIREKDRNLPYSQKPARGVSTSILFSCLFVMIFPSYNSITESLELLKERSPNYVDHVEHFLYSEMM